METDRGGRAQKQHSLLPVPQSIVFHEGSLLIDRPMVMKFEEAPGFRTQAMCERYAARLSEICGVEVSTSFVESENSHTQSAIPIWLSSNAAVGESGFPKGNENESYKLCVEKEQVMLTGATVFGIRSGLETLLQLVEEGSPPELRICCIDDYPRFPYRGIMLDPSRHWLPVDLIKRNLDAMAIVKMNVLHLHLSDDQGFRVECIKYPGLHEGGSDGQYYTQEQVHDIVNYAADRGIRIIPEFDLPGHTTSWFVGYPEFASAPGPYQLERGWGIMKPCFDVTKEEVYTFLDGFFEEMCALFPDDYMHIGGDEVVYDHWENNAEINKYRMEHEMEFRDLQLHFNQRILQIISKHGKKVVGWDEILHPSLPNSIIVQSWRGHATLVDAALGGYSSILSSGYYLDHIRPAAFHYQADPIPADSPLNEKQQSLILGGEACMWSEYVTHENVESRLWPRVGAIAERLWSAREVTDVRSMYRRLDMVNKRVAAVGVRNRVNYDMMLRRLPMKRIEGPHGGDTMNVDEVVDEESVAAVKTLADWVEPLNLFLRHQASHYSIFTPMNRLVDTAMPESDCSRDFTDSVEQLLSASDLESESRKVAEDFVVTCCDAWRRNHSQVKHILDQSHLLREALPLSELLSELALVVLDSLHFLQTGEMPTVEWIHRQQALLDTARQPRAEVKLPVVSPAIECLVQAVINRSSGHHQPKEQL